ncbi:ABC transporter permease [Hathewaya histolytica]|uniref:ABC transporter permease n=1 Tax=Hathewaya histolytica TaxID=1498 RepID=A0A4U9QVB5_HATHI|nr:ABC transporter permease [Hathewaya histolytica]VTQ82289.1 ABC transporter permease [Hathewaya histolytica]
MNFNYTMVKKTLRTLKTYYIYLISEIFSIATFFIFFSIENHPSLKEAPYEQIAGRIATYRILLYIFSIIFIISSFIVFIYWRRKEFNIIKVLGFSKKELTKMIFIESLIMSIISMVLGIILGIALLKFFLIILDGIIKTNNLNFYISIYNVYYTIIMYSYVFVLLPVICYKLIDKFKKKILLYKNRKQKNFSILLIISSIGFFLFILEVYLLINIFNGNMRFSGVIILLLVCFSLRNYIFFMYVIELTLKVLSSIKSMYYKKVNIIVMSSLKSKLRENTLLLMFTTMFLSISFIIMSNFYIMNFISKKSVDVEFPFTINYTTSRNEVNEKFIDDILNKNSIKYSKAEVNIFEVKDYNIISVEDYNNVASILNFPRISLKENEAVLLPQFPRTSKEENAMLNKEITVDKDRKVTIIRISNERIFFQGLYHNNIVMNKSLISELNIKEKETFIGYEIEKWENLYRIDRKIRDEYKSIKKTLGESVFLMSKIEYYREHREESNLTLYLTIFISLILYFGAMSFIHFKFYLDLEDNKENYKTMLSLGMSSREIKSIVTREMYVIFFLPFIVASLNTLIILILTENISYISIIKECAIILVVFFIISALFFLVWRMKNIDLIFFESD